MNEIRKINELGMIVIPQTIRKELNVNYKDKVEIHIEKEKIILKKITINAEIKDNTIIRTIDELGRIIIPFEIRQQLNINKDDKLEISIENNTIILLKTK